MNRLSKNKSAIVNSLMFLLAYKGSLYTEYDFTMCRQAYMYTLYEDFLRGVDILLGETCQNGFVSILKKVLLLSRSLFRRGLMPRKTIGIHKNSSLEIMV